MILVFKYNLKNLREPTQFSHILIHFIRRRLGCGRNSTQVTHCEYYNNVGFGDIEIATGAAKNAIHINKSMENWIYPQFFDTGLRQFR